MQIVAVEMPKTGRLIRDTILNLSIRQTHGIVSHETEWKSDPPGNAPYDAFCQTSAKSVYSGLVLCDTIPVGLYFYFPNSSQVKLGVFSPSPVLIFMPSRAR